MNTCPLCQSNNLDKVATIDKADLISLYQTLNVNVAALIKHDIDYLHCNSCQLYFYNPMITGDENFYNQLQHYDWYYSDEKEEYLFSRQYIKTGDKVLDVGSGKGAFSKLLDTEYYTGLDFSENAKKMAALNGIRIENESIDFHAENNSEIYDVVCSFQVLEHVSNPREFITSKLKALKKGGIMIIAVPAEDSFLHHVVNGVLNMPPHHVTCWSDDALRFIAQEFQLDCIAIHHEKVQPIHKQWYFSTLVRQVFMRPKKIDTSIRGKMVSRIANFLARWLAKMDANYMLPYGHTVTVVYKKQ